MDIKSMHLETFLVNHYYAFRPSMSKRTKTLYAYTLKKFGEHLGRIAKLEDLTNQIVGLYLADLLDRHAPSTAAKERRQLLAIWRDACDLGMIENRPRIQTIVIPEKTPKALTVEELQRLVAAFSKLQGETGGIPNCDVMRAVFLLQFATGERIGAVSQLRWDDLDGEYVNFRAETRKGKRRPMHKHLPPWVLTALDAIREPDRAEVFPATYGKTKLHLLYSRLFERANVTRPKGKSSHLLRSSHATYVWLAGGDASAALGHASASTTQKSYLDPRLDDRRPWDSLPKIE